MDALETPRQDIQLGARRSSRSHHVGIQQRGDGATRGVPRDDEGAGGAGGVLLQESAQAGCDREDHGAGDAEEAPVAEVAGVVEEGSRGYGVGVPVYAPVTGGEQGGAADGEDDGVHGVEGDGFEDHGFLVGS